MVVGDFDSLPAEVQDAEDKFFPDRESGLAIVGSQVERPQGLEVRPAEDPRMPLLDRLSLVERSLLDSLGLALRQQDEIDSYGEDYARQLYGEVVSTLIALRELWRCVPELRS